MAGRLVALVALVVVIAGAVRWVNGGGADAPASAQEPRLVLEPGQAGPAAVPGGPLVAILAGSASSTVTTVPLQPETGVRVVSVDSVVGEIRLSVLEPGSRPSRNHRPTISNPNFVSQAAAGPTPVRGVSVDDVDSQVGDYGLLLYIAGGSVTVDTSSGARLVGDNGAAWLPMFGSLPQLNQALAGLRVVPGPEVRTLSIVVSDLGHGDFANSESARAEVTIRDA